MRLKDKVAIVTGGASGIGRATAVRFAQEGAQVIIVDTDVSRGMDAMREMSLLAGHALFIELDIADEVRVQKAVSSVIQKYKRIDILVNNAVKFMFKGLDATVAELKESLETNLVGHFVMTKYVAAAMKKTKSGSIVFIGSISSVISQPNALTYNIPKGGMLQMTRCCAEELAPDKIRVNCICPGHVLTPAIPRVAAEAGKTLEAFEKERAQSTLLKRVAQPEEIANAILFFASDESSYVTGAHLMVDAGYTTV